MTKFFAPTRPYTLIDAINRMALATGSCIRAQQGASADYNGHAVMVERGDFCNGGRLDTEEQKEARGWRAHYTWSGLQWLARSTNFRNALDAAMREYNRGALGASVRVKALTPEQDEACRAAGLLPWSEEAEAAENAKWRTPAYDCVAEALRDRVSLGLDTIAILRDCAGPADYRQRVDAALKARREMVGARR